MAYTDIDKPSDYFETKLYTGNGSTQSITGVGFQPDFCWFKRRDNGTANHALQDSVRGVTKFIQSNTTAAEATSSNYLTSFNSDGFSLGSDGDVNDNGANHVAWNWLANGAGSANTDGSISSTVSANTTAGFSIVSYTGTGANATVGHGLGVAPKMIIIKNTDISANWLVYHDSIPATNTLILNTTDASASDAAWNNTDPTSSVFSIGVTGSGNGSGNNLIAYCFAEKQGFSKAFSFTGNGSSDGSYCHLGFKASFILGKNSDNASENWFIFDNKRDIYNTAYHQLFPNSIVAEGTNSAQNIDILSSGFKCRSAETRFNGSGNIIIGIAFAENPFVTSTGVPATAR
jgi:hypothetical protein